MHTTLETASHAVRNCPEVYSLQSGISIGDLVPVKSLYYSFCVTTVTDFFFLVSLIHFSIHLLDIILDNNDNDIKIKRLAQAS